MNGTLLIEAIADAVINPKRKQPDTGLLEASTSIAITLAQPSTCPGCDHLPWRHWRTKSRCDDCTTCTGWPADGDVRTG